VTQADIEAVRVTLPELPEARRHRYVAQYGLPVYDADVLTREKPVSEFYEAACSVSTDKKAVSNWVMGEVLRVLKEGNLDIADLKFSAAHIGELVNLIHSGAISGKIAKTVFEHMLAGEGAPADIVKARNLSVINDASAVEGFIRQVMDANADKVAEYRSGKDKLFGFFVGQVMKVSQGKAGPEQVNALLKDMLAG
jgi:aspartyl-tRNA(Asn)/glutamyl-tRNA(Gln) amidotransferase subunit B